VKQSDITYAVPPQPRQIRLDTTTNCNAKCLSCHRFLSNRHGEMHVDLINEVLDDVARWESPLVEIVPVNYGEFFLYPHWEYVLNAIKRKLPNTQVVIPTNGWVMTSGIIKVFAEIPNIKVINFSVNAFFEDTYEQFTGLNAKNIESIRNNIKHIHLLRPDITVWASMVFDPMYQTDLERDNFIQYWTGIAIPQVIPAASARRPEKKPCKPVLSPCRSLFSDMVIGYDRKISSCCFDPSFSLDMGYYSGDAKKDWNSDRMQRIREIHNQHKRTEIELCKECTYA